MKSNAWKIIQILALAIGLTGLAFTSGVALGYVAPRFFTDSGERVGLFFVK